MQLSPHILDDGWPSCSPSLYLLQWKGISLGGGDYSQHESQFIKVKLCASSYDIQELFQATLLLEIDFYRPDYFPAVLREQLDRFQCASSCLQRTRGNNDGGWRHGLFVDLVHVTRFLLLPSWSIVSRSIQALLRTERKAALVIEPRSWIAP